MKKYLYKALIFFLLGGTIYAQDYDPILKEGSFWDSEEVLGGVCSFDYIRYRTSDDVIIDGKTYKQLQRALFAGNDNDPNYPCRLYEYPRYVNESDFVNVSYYLREDIAEKKVYVWTDFLEHPGREYILYDFTIEVGDVLTSDHFMLDGAELTSIETDADGRKQYHFADRAVYYTEGIGSSVEIINFERIIGLGDRELFCWGNTANPNGCAPTILSSSDEQLAQIQIFPNPTSDVVRFTNLNQNTFQLYSVLGKEMSYSFSEERQEMDISHLRTGIYFLKIRDTQKAERIVKIIKN